MALTMFRGDDGAVSTGGGFRLPPQNLEAEANVLAGVLLDANARFEVLTFLTPEDFYRDSHRRMFAAVRDLDGAGVVVDAVTLAEELERRGEMAAVGGLDAFAAIFNGSLPSAASAAPHYAQIVKQKAIKRDLIDASNELLRVAYADDRTAEETLELAERRILGLSQPTGDGPEPIAALTRKALERLDARREGEVFGVPTGLIDLERIVGPLQARRLYVVAARPSIGKSAFTLGVADHAAFEGGVPTLFVSLEMDGLELAERFLSNRSGVDSYWFRNAARIKDGDAYSLADADARFARDSRLHVFDAAELTLAQLGAHARRHKSKHGLGLLVIDYMQLLNGPRLKGESREGEVSRISKRLRGLAKELNVPVIAVAQLNRAAEQRSNHEPTMADLRESGQIEQDANTVILLHRPEYYDPNDHPGAAFAIVAKNRGGATGKVRLAFNKHLTRFGNYVQPPPGAEAF